MKSRLLLGTLALAGWVCGSTAGATNVTVQSSFLGGPPTFVAGSTVTVRLAITANSTGQTPALAAIRLVYDSALFSFSSATGSSANGYLGEVDPLSVGNPETVSGTTVSRDIPTNGNFTNTSQTPVIMDVNLVVVATSVVPTTIGVQFDPGVSAGLNSLTDVNAVPITSRVIDASGTTNILVPVELSGFAVE